jgi:hypothetical protein
MRTINNAGLLLAAGLVAVCTASCSGTSTNNVTTSDGAVAAGADTCKDFWVPLYPSCTSRQCESSGTGRATAYLDSADSVDQVRKYYESLPGWQLKPSDPGVNSSTHAVVVLQKPPGYASIVINPGPGGKGSSSQIHAYPSGN